LVFTHAMQALELTDGQLSLLKDGWQKTTADRSALLQQHCKLAARLQQLQQATKQQQQQFSQGIEAAFQQHYSSYSQPCAMLWQQQQPQMLLWQPCHGSAPYGADAAATAGFMPAAGLSSIGSGSGRSAWNMVHFLQPHAAAYAPSCSQAASCSTTQHYNCTPNASCQVAAAAAAPAAAAPAAAAAAPMPIIVAAAGVRATRQSSASPCPQGALSVSGSTNGQDHPAAAAEQACHLTTDPDLLLDSGCQAQQLVEQQMQKLLNAAAVLYFTQHLQIYNALSRKQLAVAAVASWPWQFEPMALCDALDDMGWAV
jgi:hypothetical protein